MNIIHYMQPLEMLKLRWLTAPAGTYSGLGDLVRKTLVREGVGVLLPNMGAALARAFITNAFCFLGFEASRTALNRLF